MKLPAFERFRSYPLSEIPNQAGFRLVLVHGNGAEILVTVAKDETGCHYCAGTHGRIELRGFTHWKLPDPSHGLTLAVLDRASDSVAELQAEAAREQAALDEQYRKEVEV